MKWSEETRSKAARTLLDFILAGRELAALLAGGLTMSGSLSSPVTPWPSISCRIAGNCAALSAIARKPRRFKVAPSRLRQLCPWNPLNCRRQAISGVPGQEVCCLLDRRREAPPCRRRERLHKEPRLEVRSQFRPCFQGRDGSRALRPQLRAALRSEFSRPPRRKASISS